MKIKLPSVFLIFLFVVTRLFIWVYRPVEFTEIIYSYMPYAHRWAAGEVPYLQMWYEYPPATIPLFYLPHLIDMGSIGMPIHLNYLQAYRGMLLLIDIGLFVLIWKTLRKYKAAESVFAGGLIYYALATAKAHHFIYDTMDITFAAALSLTIAAPLLWPTMKGHLISWLGYFLAVSLKLVNAPLALVYVLLERKNLKRLLLTGIVAGTLVWLLPLAYFRSSLQVMLVYHQIRGLQVESAPAVIVSTVDAFTHSEQFIEAYKNYEVAGPVSDKVKRIFDVLFPAALLTYLIYASLKAYRLTEKQRDLMRHYLTLLYVFVFIISAKVLSTPFLLWHIPLLAMLPHKTLTKQLSFTIPSLIIIIMSMSPIPRFPVGIFTMHHIIGWIRTGFFAYLTVATVLLIEKNYAKKD
jgi:hypothetical protein